MPNTPLSCELSQVIIHVRLPNSLVDALDAFHKHECSFETKTDSEPHDPQLRLCSLKSTGLAYRNERGRI
jgi:hypothetical protein